MIIPPEPRFGRPRPAIRAVAAHAAAEEGALARIRRTKQLRVALAADDMPWSAQTATGGEWQGACVAMARDLAQALDVAPVPVRTAAADLVAAVAAGKADLALPVAPSVQRALAVDLSRPVLHDDFVLLSRPGFAPRRWATLNIPETRIAVANGTTADTVARHFAGNATITGFRTWDDAVGAVRSGRSDCAVAPAARVLIALQHDRALGWLVVPAPTVRIPYCVALHRDDGHGRLRDIVDAWCEDNRSNGRITGWIAAALAGRGVDPAAVPPTISF